MSIQIAYLYSNGNNVGEFAQNTSLLSSTYASSHGISVYVENIRRSIALFNVRSLSKHTWVNDSNVSKGRKK